MEMKIARYYKGKIPKTKTFAPAYLMQVALFLNRAICQPLKKRYNTREILMRDNYERIKCINLP